MNFATNKHLSTTAGSLNDTKSLPFSQKAAIITYIGQLNPINTHKPRPFTIRCSSLLPRHLRLPLPMWTIRLLFQLKLLVCINSPPPLTCATCWIMVMIPIFLIQKLYYTLFSIHMTFRVSSNGHYLQYFSLEVVQSIQFPTVTTNLTPTLNSAIYAGEMTSLHWQGALGCWSVEHQVVKYTVITAQVL